MTDSANGFGQLRYHVRAVSLLLAVMTLSGCEKDDELVPLIQVALLLFVGPLIIYGVIWVVTSIMDDH